MPDTIPHSLADRAVDALVKDALDQPKGFSNPLLDGIERTAHSGTNAWLEYAADAGRTAIYNGPAAVNEFFRTYGPVMRGNAPEAKALAVNIIHHLSPSSLAGLDIAAANVSPAAKEALYSVYQQAAPETRLAVINRIAGGSALDATDRKILAEFKADLGAGTYTDLSGKLVQTAGRFIGDMQPGDFNRYADLGANDRMATAQTILNSVDPAKAAASTAVNVKDELKWIAAKQKDLARQGVDAMRGITARVDQINTGMAATSPQAIEQIRAADEERALKELLASPMPRRGRLDERAPVVAVEIEDDRFRFVRGSDPVALDPLTALHNAAHDMAHEENAQIEQILKQPFKPSAERAAAGILAAENMAKEAAHLPKSSTLVTVGVAVGVGVAAFANGASASEALKESAITTAEGMLPGVTNGFADIRDSNSSWVDRSLAAADSVTAGLAGIATATAAYTSPALVTPGAEVPVAATGAAIILGGANTLVGVASDITSYAGLGNRKGPIHNAVDALADSDKRFAELARTHLSNGQLRSALTNPKDPLAGAVTTYISKNLNAEFDRRVAGRAASLDTGEELPPGFRSSDRAAYIASGIDATINGTKGVGDNTPTKIALADLAVDHGVDSAAQVKKQFAANGDAIVNPAAKDRAGAPALVATEQTGGKPVAPDQQPMRLHSSAPT